MNDIISIVSAYFREFFSSPIILTLFCLLLIFSTFSMFLRLICPSSTFSFFDWFKNKFIDFLKLFVPFPFLYKLGLARLGVDYVDCETQLCSDCPFLSTCNQPKKEGSSNEA